MSRKYQGLIVLNTKSVDASVEDLVSNVAKEFESEGAKVEKIAQLGRRQFAYNSRHLEAGHYVSYTLNAAPDAISRIQSRLRLNDSVHLQHYLRLA